MNKTTHTLVNGLRHLLFCGAVIFGLLVIVGTSDEQDPPKVLNTPPTAVISSPADGATFAEGAYLSFGGTATDTEDGTVAPSALSWSSDIDGFLGVGPSLTTEPLTVGIHTITLTATDSKGSANSTTIKITINPDDNTLPTASISNPADASSHSKGHYITFSGSATDAEDGALEGDALVWRSSVDGVIGEGSSISTRDLTAGTHTITLSATDKDGYTGTASITLTVGNMPPTATINYPADGATLSYGDLVTFSGSGSDTEDGKLMGNQLEWRSNKDQQIGIGESPTVNWLEIGDHTITLTVTDSDGETGSDTIEITIENAAPTATINSPIDGATYNSTDLIVFSGSAEDDDGGPFSFSWYSNLDGDLGSGKNRTVSGLSVGSHLITLQVTDRYDESSIATINITVQ